MTTTDQHDPDHLDAQAAKLVEELSTLRAQAAQARSAVDTARQRAEAAYWQERTTEFYETVRPQLDQEWKAFEAAVIGDSDTDPISAWRDFARLRAQAQGEHEALRGAAVRYGLTGVRPHLVTAKGTFAEGIAEVLTRWEEDQRTQATTHLRSAAKARADEAEQEARAEGTVPVAPRIVARFLLGPSGVARNSGIYPVKLQYPGDGRIVYFRDGRYYALDEETAELIRATAKRHSIREIDEHNEVIDTFGDLFTPRP